MFQQVYEALVSNPGQKKIVQFVPFEYDGVFIVHQQDNVVDIGVSKAKYLQIFKLAHDYWYENKQQFDLPQNLDNDTLEKVYHVTVCFLMTTNDHHLIIKAHENVLIELYKRDHNVLTKEFEIISTLVASKLKKINKNSLLWHLIRQLSVILDIQCCSPLYEVILNRTFQSCENHFANYYANYYLLWLIHINYVVNRTANQPLLERLIKLCHGCLSDVSLWTNLRVLLYSTDHTEAINDYNHMVRDLNTKFGTCLQEISFDLANTTTRTTPLDYPVAKEIEWLLAVQCPYETPYLLIMNKTCTDIIQASISASKSSMNSASSATFTNSFVATLQSVVDKAEKNNCV